MFIHTLGGIYWGILGARWANYLYHALLGPNNQKFGLFTEVINTILVDIYDLSNSIIPKCGSFHRLFAFGMHHYLGCLLTAALLSLDHFLF